MESSRTSQFVKGLSPGLPAGTATRWLFVFPAVHNRPCVTHCQPRLQGLQKAIWLGSVEAPDKSAVIEKAAQEFKTEARRLAIAEDQRIRQHIDAMPPSWGTPYEITHLDDSEFSDAITEGRIHPEMERTSTGRCCSPMASAIDC